MKSKKRIRRSFSCLVVCASLICTMPMVANGKENQEPEMENLKDSFFEIDASQYDENAKKMEQVVNEALESHDQVRVVNLPEAEEERVMLRSGAANATAYTVRNVKSLSESYGADYLTAWGAPGVTVGLSREKTKTYSLEFGSTFQCPKGIIASATWGSSKSVKLTYSGSFRVPSKHNGKRVKKAALHMRPVYKRKQYDVYSKSYGSSKWTKKGTSTTKKAYAVDLYKTFKYY